jgi:two-component system, cell cycle response regulator
MSTLATILVAEDSLVIRAVLRRDLEEAGYVVVEAVDGESALDRVRELRPDTILLDIEMPGRNGHEVLAALKADDAVRDIPVIFLTGRTGTKEMVAGLRAGAHDYLKKPFEATELIARVSGAVRIKKLQDELLQRNAELDRLSRVDALTGAYNRRHIDEQLQQHASAARRHGQPLSVLLFDIDHFKRVNDTEGHGGGDLVLCEITRRINDSVRAEDIVGRWGGEEFLVVLPQTALEGALVIGERTREAVARTPVIIGDHAITVTLSGGCAGNDRAEPDDLIRRADEALYCAKGNGRNRIEASQVLTAAVQPGP